MAGLYIHIPYCRRKCLYCDFFSGGARQASWSGLADALLLELRNRKDEISEPLTTFYVGGGTPSMMPPEELTRLVTEIRNICGSLWQPGEATIELNPEDVTSKYVDTLIRLGFNRLSLGVQILDDDLLASIGRRHNARCAIEAMNILKEAPADMSVDLMFGLPGMSDDIWARTIDRVIKIAPEHISAYALMYEPGTALTALRDSGRISAASDDEYESQYILLTERLSEAGYRHYETSNYALQGHHSRHNTSYWTGVPYIGLGPGAHSYDGARRRRANRPDLKAYLAGDVPHDVEILTDEMLCDEYLLTRLRMAEGIDLADFAHRFGDEMAHKLLFAAGKISGIDLDANRLSINSKNVLTADDIISTLAAAL